MIGIYPIMSGFNHNNDPYETGGLSNFLIINGDTEWGDQVLYIYIKCILHIICYMS